MQEDAIRVAETVALQIRAVAAALELLDASTSRRALNKAAVTLESLAPPTILPRCSR